MSNTASLKKEYAERIAPALKSQFQYSSTMQVPVLKKIVINQDRKSTRLNSSHWNKSRMPSSA